MPIPTNGVRQLIIPADSDGNAVGVVLGAPNRLAVDCTVSVAPPGATITTDPDVAVPAAMTVALGAPPAGTTRMRYMNTVAGSVVRLREVGGAAGSGMLLFFGGQQEYGAEGGSIAAMEAEHVSGPDSAVAAQFEGP
jgi:hypothetical protein